MNKKFALFFSLFIILVFIGYMIFDSVRPESSADNNLKPGDLMIPQDSWKISKEFKVNEGKLEAVTVSPSGNIYLGGDSFVSCYDNDLKLLWSVKTPGKVTSLSFYGDTIYASTMELVLVISSGGKIKNEWGPFEDKSIITSVSANKSYVAFADAGNKLVFILDKGGEVKKMVGQNDGQFIIPSPYFDVALNDDNTLFVANTGHRRVETRNINGDLLGYFGEPGLAPEAFCGCCNPAHIVLIPDGFITAEKGINRIKILNRKGEFVEFVSSKNDFTASVPLDLASADGKTIYAANPADSKLYVFKRIVNSE
jgi:PQQ-like domain